MAWLKNLKIPVPDLCNQKKIAEILTLFDTVINNMNDGLPAEIMMRQRQYEYYRYKLLTFKKLKIEE